MDSQRLQDRLYYSLGIAARRTGDLTDAFRPNGPDHPLDKCNRFLRLHASFLPMEGGANRANAYGTALWQGLFDAAYTRPGDYLVQRERIFFVAAQQSLLPVLCIQANRTISISQPALQTSAASNPYGGYTESGTTVLMNGWPASVLGANEKGEPAAGLPTDQLIPYMAVLMPASPGVNLSPGDLISDDLGRSAVIIGSELSHLGWRLTAKLATT
jgi:hypothetical protein